MAAFTSPFHVKLAATPAKRLPTNWPWPVVKVPSESSRVPRADPLELVDEEELDDELDDELELLDEELELLEFEVELDDELLDELDEELDEALELLEELLEEEPLEEVPPHAVKVTAIALAHKNRARGDGIDPGLNIICS